MTTSVAVRERPILFSGPMVLAILEGKKTQTRRVMTPQPTYYKTVPEEILSRTAARVGEPGWWWAKNAGRGVHSQRTDADFKAIVERWPDLSQYGQPGDRLWVRETHTLLADQFGIAPGINYTADDSTVWNVAMPDGVTVYNAARRVVWKRRPSIFMLRAHSRITLELTGVRVERLHDISEDDARAEGVDPCFTRHIHYDGSAYRCEYQHVWDALNSPRGFGWFANPWVWVLEFRRIEA